MKSSRNTTFAPPASPRCGSMRRGTSARRTSPRSTSIQIASSIADRSRGDHFILAYRLYEWKKANVVDPSAIAAKLKDLADRGGVGLTPPTLAVERAFEAFAAVNTAIEKMGASGGLHELNAAFKAARAGDPAVRYVDYLEVRKAAMLEALTQAAA
jgi:hypothetical protein